MDDRRIETAPAWLIILAAAALGTSFAVTRWAPTSKAVAAIDPPTRTQSPLRWRIADLPPVATPQLALRDGSRLSVRIAAVAVDPPTSVPNAAALAFGPTEQDLLSSVPIAPAAPPAVTGYGGAILVLVPAEPQWRAGVSRPRVLARHQSRRWQIGAWNSLASARAVGRIVASLSVSSRTPDAAKPPQLALVAPRVPRRAALAVTPRRYAVTPIDPPQAPTTPLSIAEYLARGSQSGSFPVAAAIGDQLDRVASSRQAAPWAWAVAYRLRTLSGSSADDRQARRALAALEDASAEAFRLAEDAPSEAAATELRRAGYALARRLAAWNAEQSRVLALLERPAPALDKLTGARWAMASDRRGLPYGALLRGEAGSRPALRVAQRIENYEQRPTSLLARTLAADAQRLAATGETNAVALAAAINQNYRNANVRVAIGADLIRRLLPQPEPLVAPVRDRIAGTPVSGRSTTETKLGLVLVPDQAAWRIGLEAEGLVTSRTVSRGGPAVLGAHGLTSFNAKKLLLLTPQGMQAAPTVASARVRSQRLTSLRTDYDRVPLLGSYVRSTAKEEYGRMRSRAQAETRLKIEQKVRRTLDGRITPQLAQIESRFASEVTDRFARLGLRVEPIEMRSTEQRLITRVRVANDAQLAAHTPRMRAPSDSLLSLQVHESTLNNALDGLGLAGLTLTSDELRDRLVERLQIPKDAPSGGERATLRFAAVDPIRFRLAEGRAELTLAFDGISVRGRRHRDFKVHAFYRPEVNGLMAELVQDGTPHIEGRMRTASRMHLHGVMGRVLGTGERVPLVRVTEETPAGMARALVGLATNQFVIEDGWLGLAIGPPRPAERTALQVGGYVR